MLDKEQRFNAMITENSDRIHRICKYYNSNSEDQKDMYQEVLINIWNSLENFEAIRPLAHGYIEWR
ncbi:MAG: sigma factor [Salinivirgaceae bacterium]|nr:sigma factor [Salinivirgaceae bacterium]